MVSSIHNNSLASIPSIDIGGADTSRQQQQQGRSSAGREGRGFAPGAVAGAGADSLSLSPESQQQINKLQQRDREVRSHEQSHISAGGAHVSGGAHYTYQRGPDNKQYAVGGSVSIDTAPVSGDPDATREKARQVRSAALAPSNPSAQDQSVAAQASSLEVQARQEENSQRTEGKAGTDGKAGVAGGKSAEGTEGATGTASTKGEEGTKGTDGAKSAEGTLATGFFAQARPADFAARAAAAYQTVQQQGIAPTQLAPFGTGIAISV